jgi:hypothetical protein
MIRKELLALFKEKVFVLRGKSGSRDFSKSNNLYENSPK